jgi:hypothetical protein
MTLLANVSEKSLWRPAMKNSPLILAALISGILLAVSPVAAFAGTPGTGVVPEPSAILIWAVIAGAGGAAYWWRNRNKR